MTPTPEEIEALRKSSATLAALCDRATQVTQLIDENRRLKAELQQSREMRTSLRETTAAELDRLQSELLVAQDGRSSLMIEVDRLRAELAEARAENGRQAATIAAMRKAAKVHVEIDPGDPCSECDHPGPAKWSQGMWRCPECWHSMEKEDRPPSKPAFTIAPPSGPGLSGSAPLVPFGSPGCPSLPRLDLHSRYDMAEAIKAITPTEP